MSPSLLTDNVSRIAVQLIIIIAAAQLMGRVVKLIGQPRVVGEMLAGLLLGPSGFGRLFPQSFALVFPSASLRAIDLLGSFGVCFYIFTSAASLDLKDLRSRAPIVLAVSNLSMLFPFVFGLFAAALLSPPSRGLTGSWAIYAAFVGIAMSVSALPVLLRIIAQQGLGGTNFASVAVSCAVADDLVVWISISVLLAISSHTSLAGTFFSVTLAVIFMWMMLTWVRSPLLKLIRQAKTVRWRKNLFYCVAACLLVGSASITKLLGIHEWFGSFLAGCAIPRYHALEVGPAQRVQKACEMVFLPLFFVSGGLRADIARLDSSTGWISCFVVICLAALGKMGGAALGARAYGWSWPDALSLGALLNTRGLVELLVIKLGLLLGILTPGTYTMLALMALFTTFMAGPVINMIGRFRIRSHRRDRPLLTGV